MCQSEVICGPVSNVFCPFLQHAVSVLVLHTRTSEFRGRGVQAQDDVQIIQEALSAYLKRVRAERGWSMNKTGEIAGVSKTTISRNENRPPDYSYLLSTRSIQKIARASGIAPPPELSVGANGKAVGFAEPEVTPIDDGQDKYGEEENPNQSRWVINGRTLELAGFVPGDVVTIDQAVPAVAGDIVCAQIYSHGTAETVIRRYNPPYLVVATADPAAMALEPEHVDGRNVTIKGTVIRTVRERRS